MKIYLDVVGKNSFFISIPLGNDREILSFDHTTKGSRIMRQRWLEEKEISGGVEITAEWDTLVLENGKIVDKAHVEWVDMGKLDWVDGQVWETVWETPPSKELAERLLYYSNLIVEQASDLERYPKEIREFENLLVQQREKYGDAIKLS